MSATLRNEGGKSPAWLEDAQKLKAGGATLKDIATRYDATVSRVHYWLNRAEYLAKKREERGRHYVYFIQPWEGGAIKIGYGSDIHKRLGQAQTGNPKKLVVTHKIEVVESAEGYALEARLHKQFSHLRLVGEWFTADDELASVAHGRPSEKADARAILQRAYLHGYTDGQMNRSARLVS